MTTILAGRQACGYTFERFSISSSPNFLAGSSYAQLPVINVW